MTTTPYQPNDVAAAVARALAANDRPDPEFDADCSPRRYAALAQSFRSSAWKHLDDGGLPQASYKPLVLGRVDISAQPGEGGHKMPKPQTAPAQLSNRVNTRR